MDQRRVQLRPVTVRREGAAWQFEWAVFVPQWYDHLRTTWLLENREGLNRDPAWESSG